MELLHKQVGLLHITCKSFTVAGMVASLAQVANVLNYLILRHSFMLFCLYQKALAEERYDDATLFRDKAGAGLVSVHFSPLREQYESLCCLNFDNARILILLQKMIY